MRLNRKQRVALAITAAVAALAVLAAPMVHVQANGVRHSHRLGFILDKTDRDVVDTPVLALELFGIFGVGLLLTAALSSRE